MAASGSLARAVCSSVSPHVPLSTREKESIPYEPMSPTELADLEREAGRSLTEEEAQQFRIRKLKKQLIENMLDQAARTGGAL